MKNQFNRDEIAVVITKDGEIYADYPNLDLLHFDALQRFYEQFLTQATFKGVAHYIIADMAHSPKIAKLIDAKREELEGKMNRIGE